MDQICNHNGSYKIFINDNKTCDIELKQNVEEKL